MYIHIYTYIVCYLPCIEWRVAHPGLEGFANLRTKGNTLL